MTVSPGYRTKGGWRTKPMTRAGTPTGDMVGGNSLVRVVKDLYNLTQFGRFANNCVFSSAAEMCISA